jgi:hypothetical protein
MRRCVGQGAQPLPAAAGRRCRERPARRDPAVGPAAVLRPGPLDHCPRRTFAEEVQGLAVRYGRRTPLLRARLEQLAHALAPGSPGRSGPPSAGHPCSGWPWPCPTRQPARRGCWGGRLHPAPRPRLRHRALPGLAGFAGLEGDLEAVTRGLTTRWAPARPKGESTTSNGHVMSGCGSAGTPRRCRTGARPAVRAEAGPGRGGTACPRPTRRARRTGGTRPPARR